MHIHIHTEKKICKKFLPVNIPIASAHRFFVDDIVAFVGAVVLFQLSAVSEMRELNSLEARGQVELALVGVRSRVRSTHRIRVAWTFGFQALGEPVLAFVKVDFEDATNVPETMCLILFTVFKVKRL